MDMVDKSDQATIPVKDRVEFLTKVYDRMAGLTANADTKAGIILATSEADRRKSSDSESERGNLHVNTKEAIP